MKKNIYMFLILALISQNSSAKTFSTIRRGFWFSQSVWENNDAPNYTCGDTIIIKHFVDFDKNIFLTGGAFLRIDSTGGLCGHHTITVYSNAMLYKYGYLQIDSMLVTGGEVILDAPKDAIFSKSAIITIAGASMYVKGCKLSVGPWFQCSSEEYQSSVFNPEINKNLSLYPNPNNGRFTIHVASADNVTEFKLTDLNGKDIIEQKIIGNKAEFDISTLANGIYHWQLISDNRLIDKGKISLIH